MNKLSLHGFMFICVIVVTLCFLWTANEYGGYWINVSWATGVWFGIEGVCYLNEIEEFKKQKKHELEG